MSLDVHKSVGIVITNSKRDLFYFQQKDETYWIEQFRMKYCVFGGQIETGETEDFALKRELLEELDEEVAEKIYKKSKKKFNSSFVGILNKDENFALYESVLPLNELLKISSLPVREGKRGILMKKEDISLEKFMSDQHKPLKKYFELDKSI